MLVALPALCHAAPVADGRSLLYREFNLAAFYSWHDARLGFQPVPPLSAAGFEFFHKFPDTSPGLLNPDILDLYLQLAYDPDDGRLEVRFQDVWMRFAEPASGLKVRLGHFDLPFGMNPITELRGQVLRPLTTLDLGFKKDWGVAVQGEWRTFAYETAATWGIGEELRRRRGRFLLSGRLGMPTYRDIQYGISLLYGAVSRGDVVSREGPKLQQHTWRLGVDLAYLYHEPFTTFRGELIFGGDEGSPVGGFLLELTQILPSRPHWGIEAQLRTWKRGAPPKSSTTPLAVTRTESAVGFWHSLPALLTLRLHWQHFSSYEAFDADDRLFAQLYYYGP
jgi:hypothetical protein